MRVQLVHLLSIPVALRNTRFRLSNVTGACAAGGSRTLNRYNNDRKGVCPLESSAPVLALGRVRRLNVVLRALSRYTVTVMAHDVWNLTRYYSACSSISSDVGAARGGCSSSCASVVRVLCVLWIMRYDFIVVFFCGVSVRAIHSCWRGGVVL